MKSPMRKMRIACRRCKAEDIVTFINVERNRRIKPVGRVEVRGHSWLCRTLVKIGWKAKCNAVEVKMDWMPEGKKSRTG